MPKLASIELVPEALPSSKSSVELHLGQLFTGDPSKGSKFAGGSTYMYISMLAWRPHIPSEPETSRDSVCRKGSLAKKAEAVNLLALYHRCS